MNYKQLLLPLLTAAAFATQAQTITIVAGNGNPTSSGDGGPATAAAVDYMTGLDADSAGNLYLSDEYSYHIRKIGTNDTITLFAGSTYGFSGDGAAATDAQLGAPDDVVVDRHGNVYIADDLNARIRKVNTAGIISTYAGNGALDTLGDGGPATNAGFVLINRIAIDDSGNLYIADNNRIRKVNTSGIITTVAGKTTAAFSGDGGLAVNASFAQLQDITVDHKGDLYVLDSFFRIRKIGTDGIIHTIAGGNTTGYTGDGGPATAALLGDVTAIKADRHNNLYLSIGNDSRIRKIDTEGIINTFIGNSICNYAANGAELDTAGVCSPSSIAVDGYNDVYYYDNDHRIRKITFADAAPSSVTNNTLPVATIGIYPNPAIDIVTITNLEMGDRVRVIDLTGRAMNCMINSAIQGENNLDVTSIIPGIYIFSIINDKGIIKARIKFEKK